MFIRLGENLVYPKIHEISVAHGPSRPDEHMLTYKLLHNLHQLAFYEHFIAVPVLSSQLICDYNVH